MPVPIGDSMWRPFASQQFVPRNTNDSLTRFGSVYDDIGYTK